MARLIELGGRPVNEAERLVVEHLVERLPGYFCVAPNLTLTVPRTGHRYEYDIVVLTGHGVYVVEVKGWRGTTHAIDRAKWQRGGGRYIDNPLPLVDAKAKVLASHLDTLSFVNRGRPIRRPFVDFCLVSPLPDAVFEVFDDDRPRCLTLRELDPFIRDAARLPVRTEPHAYRGMMRKLASYIAGTLEKRDPEPRRLGAYRVTETIEQTDETTVYDARHADFDDGRIYRARLHSVSHYRYDAEERAARLGRLKRRAEALTRIGAHPNIVALRAYDTTDDGFYEITDWSERGTLATALAQGALDGLDALRRLDMMRGIARGLAAAAEHHVYHRDLRPDVILLDPNGTPRIGGFDLAYLLDGPTALTVYGGDTAQPLVDVPHRPPELRDPDDYDVFDNSDLYSLGRLAYDIFTGEQPPGLTPSALSERLPDALAVPPEVAADLDALVAACVAVDPADRPSSAAGVVARLDRLIEQVELALTAPQPQANFEAGDEIDGLYTVHGIIGRGAGATVYRVFSEVQQARFALKLAHPDADPDGPLREWHALWAIRSRAVPRAVTSSRLDDGRGYLLTELLDGPTLAERMPEGEPYPDNSITLVAALADALAHVHAAGWLHRDLKPDNIVLTEGGPVLTDFGAAAPIDAAGSAPVGSLRATPPDLDSAGWGPDADLFALAVLAVRLLTGVAPWGETLPTAGQSPRLPTDAPDAVEALLAAALAPARADRLADAEQFARDWRAAWRPPAEPRLDPTADPAEPGIDPAAEPVAVAPPAPRPAPGAPARSASPPPTATPRPAATDLAPPPSAPRLAPPVTAPRTPSPWTAAQVSDVGSAADPLARLYAAALPGQPPATLAEYLAAEALLDAIERPLPAAMPSAYDLLVQPAAPRPLDGDGAAAPVALAARDRLVVLDGLALVEVPHITAAAPDRAAQHAIWQAGVVDPALPDAAADALAHALTDPPSLHPVDDPAAARSALAGDARAIVLRLPLGRRDDDLDALISRRAALIAALVTEAARAAGRGRIYVTATFGAIYLGHGLRRDIGSGAGPAADRVRAAWRRACPDSRLGRAGGPPLRGPVDRPARVVGDRVMPVGRLAWPDAATAPRLAVGGASLGERLLPLVRLDRPEKP